MTTAYPIGNLTHPRTLIWTKYSKGDEPSVGSSRQGRWFMCWENWQSHGRHTLSNSFDLMANIVNHQAKTGPFHSNMSVSEPVNSVSRLVAFTIAEWLTDPLFTLIDQLLKVPLPTVQWLREYISYLDYFIPSFVIIYSKIICIIIIIIIIIMAKMAVFNVAGNLEWGRFLRSVIYSFPTETNFK